MGYNPDVVARVRKLNIIDDVMFQKMAEDPEFCEELISTIIGKPVSVIETIPQNSIKNLQGRSVILDALCSLEKGKMTNVEVQKANDDDQIIRETGMQLENGHKVICVNTKIDDGSDIAQLMHLFKDTDAYDFEKFPKCSNRKKQFKMTEEGEAGICDLVEEYAQKVAREAAREAAEAAKEAAEKAAAEAAEQTIIKMLKRGYKIEEINEIYSDMDEAEIRKLESEISVTE